MNPYLRKQSVPLVSLYDHVGLVSDMVIRNTQSLLSRSEPRRYQNSTCGVNYSPQHRRHIYQSIYNRDQSSCPPPVSTVSDFSASCSNSIGSICCIVLISGNNRSNGVSALAYFVRQLTYINKLQQRTLDKFTSNKYTKLGTFCISF